MKNKLHFTSTDKEVQQKAFQAIEKEQNSIGYYGLPEQDITSILEYCKTISDNVETIAVIGIGGSSLGAKAVYEFIKPVKDLKRKLYFFESTDPINITTILSKFDIKKTHFLVISKSGNTVETFSIYKYIYSLQNDASSYTFTPKLYIPLTEIFECFRVGENTVDVVLGMIFCIVDRFFKKCVFKISFVEKALLDTFCTV